ncbi:sensor histidine kinase [Marilutibacter maris]|uniref:Histidine kinase n=1 Tax=Marilutibacter maris TaxID=1605891 RepID=A0A2U9T5J5_9GAMM|nr:sensor histidine kinase [Lysobacter maris]AWV07801.1 histidine kinase [Lysobacter maris]KAB8180346.1 sensor histidine kinase [Lysobacter maris]
MLNLLNHSRLLRYAGLFTWAMVGCWLLSIWLDPAVIEALPEGDVAAPHLAVGRWLAVYLSFGAVYWSITRSLGSRRTTWLDHILLFILTLCAISVSYFSSTGLGSILLMVVAGLLPWLLTLRMGLVWLIGSSASIIPVFAGPIGMPPMIAVVQSLVYMGFSSFVFVTAFVARQQSLAREEQRRLNSELRATRALLAESARVNERTRISRELHDLLGHHLTALSLNLEVAGHLSEGRVREHVRQAHTLARLLLTDVREAVSQLREGGAIDLEAALRPLAENVPSLRIHMDIESPLTLDDPERAHILLRSTQEIITNTIRHAGAANLWVKAYRDGDMIVMEARDDGRGASSPVSGNGLRGMRERLGLYGGDLKIETRPQAGFALRLALPATVLASASAESAASVQAADRPGPDARGDAA